LRPLSRNERRAATEQAPVSAAFHRGGTTPALPAPSADDDLPPWEDAGDGQPSLSRLDRMAQEEEEAAAHPDVEPEIPIFFL